MISVEDYLFCVDEVLEAMISIVEELGDLKANERLDVPGANSPFVVLTHCLGVMEYWGGHAVAGRSIERDRAAEFKASGPVAGLVTRARSARAQLAEDLVALEPWSSPRLEVKTDGSLPPRARTQGGVLLHLYRELAQHLGQMETSRDVIVAPWARLV